MSQSLQTLTNLYRRVGDTCLYTIFSLTSTNLQLKSIFQIPLYKQQVVQQVHYRNLWQDTSRNSTTKPSSFHHCLWVQLVREPATRNCMFCLGVWRCLPGMLQLSHHGNLNLHPPYLKKIATKNFKTVTDLMIWLALKTRNSVWLVLLDLSSDRTHTRKRLLT